MLLMIQTLAGEVIRDDQLRRNACFIFDELDLFKESVVDFVENLEIGEVLCLDTFFGYEALRKINLTRLVKETEASGDSLVQQNSVGNSETMRCDENQLARELTISLDIR